MGISGFWSFYSSLIKTIPISEIQGKIAFVDIILYIHKHVIGIRKGGSDVKSKDGTNIIHLYALTKIIKNFTDKNIVPICVFDGKSPLLKSDVIEKRKEQVELSKEKCEELKKINDINSDEYIKHFKRSFSITNEMLNECKEYLRYTGIPYLNALGEADPQCAGLSHYYSNINSGVFSEDSDIILYGSPCLMKDFDIRKNCVSVIYKNDVLNFLQEKSDYISLKYKTEQLKFEMQNLIDFSIIMGNDYCNGIRYNGINNRNKLFEIFVLAKYDINTFIEILEIYNELNENKILYFIPENFIEKFKESSEIYNNIEIINPYNFDIKMKKPDYKNLRSFLEKFDFRNDVIVHISESLRDLYSYHSNSIIKTKINDTCRSPYEWNTVEKKRYINVF